MGISTESVPLFLPGSLSHNTRFWHVYRLARMRTNALGPRTMGRNLHGRDHERAGVRFVRDPIWGKYVIPRSIARDAFNL